MLVPSLSPPLGTLTRPVPRAVPHASVSQHVPGHRLAEDRAVLGVVLPLLRALVYLHGLGVGSASNCGLLCVSVCLLTYPDGAQATGSVPALQCPLSGDAGARQARSNTHNLAVYCPVATRKTKCFAQLAHWHVHMLVVP